MSLPQTLDCYCLRKEFLSFNGTLFQQKFLIFQRVNRTIHKIHNFLKICREYSAEFRFFLIDLDIFNQTFGKFW